MVRKQLDHHFSGPPVSWLRLRDTTAVLGFFFFHPKWRFYHETYRFYHEKSRFNLFKHQEMEVEPSWSGLVFIPVCCWYHQQPMEDMEIWWCSFDKWGLSISKCQLNDLRTRPQTMEKRKTCYFSSWHDKTSDVVVKNSNSATLRIISGKK